jgi:GTPase SAR1 family protein
MIKNYYRGAIGVVILYDITKNETFQHCLSWLNDARSLSRKESSICLVGNKLDLRKQRQVELVTASEFSQENGILHFETSAFTGENIEEVFVCLSKQIMSKVQNGIIDSSSVSVFGQYKKMIMNNNKDEDESKKNEYRCGC